MVSCRGFPTSVGMTFGLVVMCGLTTLRSQK